MKKLSGFIFTAALLCFLPACAAQAAKQQPVLYAKMADTAAHEALSEPDLQRIYTNQELGFSFLIPDSWEPGNYSAVVKESTVELNGTTLTESTVDFLFQGDPENSLLTIQVIPKSQWKAADSSSASASPDFLGENESSVYRFILPQNSTYPVGKKADLYNSMVLPLDDVPSRVEIQSGTAATLTAGAAAP